METESRGSNSIEVGFRLLRCIEASEQPIALKSLAEQAAMSPSKAHFYLAAFVRLGLVENIEGKYTLGYGALRLGLSALARFDVMQRAREAMFAVRDETGEPVLMVVWGNLGPTIVYHAPGGQRLPIETRVGEVLPALSASGYVFLAHWPKHAAHEVIASELSSPRVVAAQPHSSIAEVERTLAQVRARGIARVPGIYGQGYVAIAAPVFDHQGTVRVALTALGRKRAASTQANGLITSALSRETRRVTAALRGEPG